MKNYKATMKEVENLVNEKILPSIRTRYVQGEVADEINARVGTIITLYRFGQLNALESLLRLFILDTFGKDYPNTINDKMKEYFEQK